MQQCQKDMKQPQRRCEIVQIEVTRLGDMTNQAQHEQHQSTRVLLQNWKSPNGLAWKGLRSDIEIKWFSCITIQGHELKSWSYEARHPKGK